MLSSTATVSRRTVWESRIHSPILKAFAKLRRARRRLLERGLSQAPLSAIAHNRRSPAGEPLNVAAQGAGVKFTPVPPFSPMFNFSANHLFLLAWKEYRSCAMLLLLDR